jgi:hypothetical protein
VTPAITLIIQEVPNGHYNWTLAYLDVAGGCTSVKKKQLNTECGYILLTALLFALIGLEFNCMIYSIIIHQKGHIHGSERRH